MVRIIELQEAWSLELEADFVAAWIVLLVEPEQNRSAKEPGG